MKLGDKQCETGSMYNIRVRHLQTGLEGLMNEKSWAKAKAAMSGETQSKVVTFYFDDEYIAKRKAKNPESRAAGYFCNVGPERGTLIVIAVAGSQQ